MQLIAHGWICLLEKGKPGLLALPASTHKRRYKSHLSMHMNSTRYVGGATPGSSVQLRGSPRLTRASTVFLPLLWCFWEEGGWGLGAGAGHHLASSLFILPTRGSATPMAATYCCTHYTEQTDRATHASAADASSPCRLSPLLKLLLAFLGLRPSTCSLRVCSVTPTAILHFQPWGKTRKCKI